MSGRDKGIVMERINEIHKEDRSSSEAREWKGGEGE